MIIVKMREGTYQKKKKKGATKERTKQKEKKETKRKKKREKLDLKVPIYNNEHKSVRVTVTLMINK